MPDELTDFAKERPILVLAVFLFDAILAIVFAVLVTHVVSIYNWL